MSVLVWNIRGLGSRASSDYLHYLLNLHRPFILAILEPKQQQHKLEDFARKYGFTGSLHGGDVNNHIWIFWNNNVQVHPSLITSQLITVSAKILGATDIIFSFVYAMCSRNARYELWSQLVNQSSLTAPWLVAGDFNTILSCSEKKGGLAPLSKIFRNA